jgi:hypothetical protein
MSNEPVPALTLVNCLDGIENQIDSAINDLRELDRLTDQLKVMQERYQEKLTKRRAKIVDIMADIRGLVEIIQEMTTVTPADKPIDDDDTLDLPTVPQL